ncbi:arginine repressor [Enterococcus sp. 8G7_MSG3316]|uniref:Arginine repressor n=1 Tax=Candidatus Enterococcus testudinis TaxID=1834191 RepID=A0A242A8G4_9ENTE|nr:ArgR family transcriptional regulator [Enterococcus sp. 8G7_MSG3316]OTN77021.1 arginine repressor [Enterococcus sp. 8G7_MSG3316]
MRKADRHLLIRQIITKYTVRTQEELLQQLEKQGVTATQATISRDIRDLKIVKIPDETGQTKFVIFQGQHASDDEKAEEQRLVQMIEEVVTKIDRVQFMTLIHTVADNAPLLAAAIDDVTMPEKVCSLAGFDTVAVISRTEEDAETFFEFIQAHAVL